ncbi:GntR family transcriptional regulator [Pigmentiphaga litoralis]|uniref:GntR family transcriptional regulator n=1 Tax=Pigmentiphaga litoralis TaxID=516702 RepID=A0A7Y9LLY3_9BURK|nr:GntR family transcriptional regulator [Pigmentiphaga litoralis]NYE21966.1 GntR family transcriptional regulator [Pigmentiphaga litoralis]NYE84419.1 GntR family transcriptional regulator [Pigmentiphaga litoralis]
MSITPATPAARPASEPATAAPPAASVAASAAGTPAPGAAFSPLYRQIKGLIVQSLDRGEWKPGEAIPSELDLASRFKVSQGTVRKAIDELAAENLLLRRQGKGTFVATHHEDRVRFRFLRMTPDDGEPVQSDSRFLECRRMRAPSEVARTLDLRGGDSVVQIRRVLSFDSVPAVIEEIFLPGAQFRGLTAERLAEYTGPMYGLFETEFGVRMIRADEKIRAVAAADSDAALLKVAAGAPLLQIERVSFTYEDRPVEMRRGLYLTTHYHYRNSLS